MESWDMKIEYAILSALVLASVSCAAAQQQTTDPAFDGFRLCFQLGQEYKRLELQGGSVDTYNALVDQWNAFVWTNYGENAGLMMQKMGTSNANVNLQKPYALGVNTSNNGIVHSIDGSGKWGPSYTTNDINALSNTAIDQYHNSDTGKIMGDGYLSGV